MYPPKLSYIESFTSLISSLIFSLPPSPAVWSPIKIFSCDLTMHCAQRHWHHPVEIEFHKAYRHPRVPHQPCLFYSKQALRVRNVRGMIDSRRKHRSLTEHRNKQELCDKLASKLATMSGAIFEVMATEGIRYHVIDLWRLVCGARRGPLYGQLLDHPGRKICPVSIKMPNFSNDQPEEVPNLTTTCGEWARALWVTTSRIQAHQAHLVNWCRADEEIVRKIGTLLKLLSNSHLKIPFPFLTFFFFLSQIISTYMYKKLLPTFSAPNLLDHKCWLLCVLRLHKLACMHWDFNSYLQNTHASATPAPHWTFFSTIQSQESNTFLYMKKQIVFQMSTFHKKKKKKKKTLWPESEKLKKFTVYMKEKGTFVERAAVKRRSMWST